jgi:hypothetical protein
VKTSRTRLEGIAKQMLGPIGPWQLVPIEISLAELEPLADILEEHVVEDALPILLSVVNLENSPAAIADFRKSWTASAFGIVGESDEDLLRFRDQLQTLWVVAEQQNLGKAPTTIESGRILKEWFSRPFSDQNAWWVEPAAAKIVALPTNFRAVAGRIVIHNQKLLATCANPACSGKFFLKRRRDQIFCLEEGCLRYGNRARNTKFRAHKAKLVPVATAKRKKKGR